ncbi:hypothetical protein [Lentzea sp. NEAU-D7]|uniref:hypothetical protein n=1 Tax=Lentzea sp. NEAU-D7 TaxID=2994667 RepID=UPI00224AFA0E|nr:hypothetical protein [Lentzea sp. NEAU-D7]MCX2948141.1 hypothetical protein [Lentzea sp. NEAU-D7]
MARKKFNLKYWAGDARQLVFWVTVALTVGAIPDLSVNVSVVLLLVLWIAAVIVAAVMWRLDKRKEGIGVFVQLSRPGDKAASAEVPLVDIHEKMDRRHRDWFRSGPDRVAGDVRAQVDWALTSIEFRLDETKIQADYDPKVFLYLHCRLEEAFILGQRVAAIWDNPSPFSSLSDEVSFRGQLNLAVRVRSISTYEREKGEVFELDFNKVSQAAVPGLVAVQAETEELSPESDSQIKKPRLAVVLYAAEQEGNYKSFKNAALSAASGKHASGYAMSADDLCDHALVLSITSDSLITSLRNGDGEKFVREIRKVCREYSKQAYGSEDVPIRLFMKGPSILAFAAGVIFPEGSKLIPWDPRMAEATVEDAPAEHEIIAIIDGDDVGTGMERSLLAGDLIAAAQYSKQVDLVLKEVIEKAASVHGVKLISSGGDSAIFGLARTSLNAFEHAISAFRAESGFKVSCGYGADCQQAFFALRLAKTSGKNVTLGAL